MKTPPHRVPPPMTFIMALDKRLEQTIHRVLQELIGRDRDFLALCADDLMQQATQFRHPHLQRIGHELAHARDRKLTAHPDHIEMLVGKAIQTHVLAKTVPARVFVTGTPHSAVQAQQLAATFTDSIFIYIGTHPDQPTQHSDYHAEMVAAARCLRQIHTIGTVLTRDDLYLHEIMNAIIIYSNLGQTGIRWIEECTRSHSPAAIALTRFGEVKPPPPHASRRAHAHA